MDWSNPWFITLILVGIIFIIAGAIMLKYPPSSINYLYGYRTKRSMSSQENWDFAQNYSSKQMIRVGMAFMASSCIGLFVEMDSIAATLAAVFIMTAGVILLFFRVEKALKER